jgi:basic membrane protein A and related proteins
MLFCDATGYEVDDMKPRIFFAYGRFALPVVLALSFVGTTHAAHARGPRSVLFIPYRGDDLSFSEAAYLGYQRLRKDGYAIDVVQDADKLSARQMEAVIDRRYAAGTRNFILAGAEMSEVATTEARQHPDAYFATLSGNAKGSNVINYCLDCRQIGGVLAGQAAVRLSSSKIVGFVGGASYVDGPEATRFQATVLHEAPNAKVLIDWTGSWSDRRRAAQLTEQQIAAGADVVVGDANIAVAAAASRYPHVKVIGWMVDASRRYHHVAASVVINTDVVFRRFLDATASGQFKGGDYTVEETDQVWELVWTGHAQ